ncbi:MAG: hypothetical protein ACFFAU_01535 [Candidatus Hodarchaeota archaeon]
MRDLVKIYHSELQDSNSVFLSLGVIPIQTMVTRKLKKQISRDDITVLNITRTENIKEDCIDCYVDYEFWSGK